MTGAAFGRASGIPGVRKAPGPTEGGDRLGLG